MNFNQKNEDKSDFLLGIISHLGALNEILPNILKFIRTVGCSGTSGMQSTGEWWKIDSGRNR